MGPVVQPSAVAPFAPNVIKPTLPAPKILAFTFPEVTGLSSAVSGHTTEAGCAYPLVTNKTIAIKIAISCLTRKNWQNLNLGKKIYI